jgi:hypothetical protein
MCHSYVDKGVIRLHQSGSVLLLDMNIFKKWGYLIFTSGLTASAVWACYWQTSKYFKSSEKWRVISFQLDRDEAIDLGELSNPSPFLYVKSNGTLSQQYLLINRARG